MIPRSGGTCQLAAWQGAMAEALRDPAELLAALDLDPALLPAAEAAAGLFPLRVPRGYLARMRRGDPADPLLRQVLPLGAELAEHPGFSTDPVGDLAARRGARLLHKYRGRALLIATAACALHCRFCFRRHFPYQEALHQEWGDALARLRQDETVQEAVLSGGDPLTLSDRRLGELARELEAIPHLTRLRLHTRLPVVLPERVDDGLLGWLAARRLPVVVVVHANHPAELDATVTAALRRLAGGGATLLNQSVLLRGVNDDAATLAALSEALFAAGVLPYYLHLLDRAQGTAHFEVPAAQAQAIAAELHARLPGYLVPRLVREVAGAAGKIPFPPGGG